MYPLEHPLCIICSTVAHPFTEKHGHSLYICKNCGLIFMYPLPLQQELETLYSDSYFSGAESGYGYQDYDQNKQSMHNTFSHYLDLIEKLQKLKRRSMLDIGSSTGYFMQMAEGRGWDMKGIEISDFAASIGRNRGLTIHTGTLETSDFPAHSFTVLTCWDVFEHLLNPHTFLAKAYQLLEDGGLLCINTPTSDSLWARTWGKYWQALLPPEHTFLFNQSNISSLLEKKHFNVLLMKKIPKRFSLTYILQILYGWSRLPAFHKLARALQHSCIGRASIPLPIRDNVFVIAMKKM